LALGPKSLALIPQGLGLDLDLVTCVLGLGSQVLVNITETDTRYTQLPTCVTASNLVVLRQREHA